MSDTHGQGPPRSSVSAAMNAVKAVLGAAGYARDPNTNPTGIEILIGERYLKQKGAPPRLVMVRTRGSSGSGGPLRIGDNNVAHWTTSFTCYLWGGETVDDATRYDRQDALIDQIVNALRVLTPGRAELSTIDPTFATNVVTYGEELQLLVTYTRSVPKDAAIWNAAIAAAATPDPMRPQGDAGTTFVVGATATGSR